jgi:hypothetical protein
MASDALNIGDLVRCRAGGCDHNRGAGEVGYITGFARFSSYHPREAFVSDSPGDAQARWCGWFWVSDLEKAAQPLTRTERFTGSYADSFAA